MLASLLKDASSVEERVRVISRLAQDQGLPSFQETDKRLVERLVLDLTQTYSEHKFLGYQLGSLLLLSKPIASSTFILTLLDRLPSQIEHIHSEVESRALGHIIQLLVQDPSEEVQSKVTSFIPRLLSSTNKLIQSEHTRVLGLDITRELIRIKNIPQQSLQGIRNTCLDHLDQPSHHPSTIDIFASSFHYNTEEEWTASWSLICSYIRICLRQLGLPIKPVSSEHALPSSLSNKVRALSGVSKALLLEHVLHGLFHILIAMLDTGNQTSFISMDFSIFIDIVNGLLPYSIEVTVQNINTTMITENQFQISPAALLIVLPAIKLDCVQLIHAILMSYQHFCVPCVPSFMRNLSVCLRLHCTRHPQLTDQILRTMTVVISCFPSLAKQVGLKFY